MKAYIRFIRVLRNYLTIIKDNTGLTHKSLSNIGKDNVIAFMSPIIDLAHIFNMMTKTFVTS